MAAARQAKDPIATLLSIGGRYAARPMPSVRYYRQETGYAVCLAELPTKG